MPAQKEQLFYEWDGLAEKWLSSEEIFDSDYPDKPISTGDPVANWLIEDIFSLSLDTNSSYILNSNESTLPGYDIVNRDPYEIIKLSLATKLIEGKVYECYMDGNGIVKYYEIGVSAGSLSSKVYYSIDNGSSILKCDNVMVTGYDPPMKRYVYMGKSGVGFDLLRYANDLVSSDSEEFWDKDRGLYPLYTTFGEILGPQGCTYQYEGAIEYGGNPDTLKELDPYSIESSPGPTYDYTKFEEVITYIYDINLGSLYDKTNTEIKFSDTSTRYVTLTGFGKLYTRKWLDSTRYISDLCAESLTKYPDADFGITLPRSDEMKFKGISAVYIHGYRLKTIKPNSTIDTDGNIIDPTDASFVVSLDTMALEPIQLTAGEDYVIVKKDDETGLSSIVFACNVDIDHLDWFGGTIGGTGDTCKFRIDLSCIYNFDNNVTQLAELKYENATNLTGAYREGQLNDVNYTNKVSSQTVYENKVIFPTGEGSSGYVVEKIVVVYQWDNPSIIISDKRNNITSTTLQEVAVKFYPVLSQDPPAPIAFKSGSSSVMLLDSNQIRPDYDPTTEQNFSDTDYMKAMSSIEGGDVSVVMPFADSDQCLAICETIHAMQNDTSHEIAYFLSPDAEPELGMRIGNGSNDGVINEIDYSYQDSSQYQISVTTGPMWKGGDSWDNSIYQLETEDLTLVGTIVSTDAYNVKCNVRLNKIGIMECINQTSDILEIGDKVSVTVKNNPKVRK